SFLARHLGRVVRFPASPARMAAWAQAWQQVDLAADGEAVTAPTLVITGEPALDRVVSSESSRDYLTLIPGARHPMITGTGHIGLVSKPQAFAAIVSGFIRDHVVRQYVDEPLAATHHAR